ncbi:MAG: hypothetical protein PHR26_03715 [Candidatus ainarchaeum sp.]|nr:hypothetical protein [Candidatus ainarchaeum sp.]MDD3976213.1 hypothetical protein [Candidatus ainarchaeum sp.]
MPILKRKRIIRKNEKIVTSKANKYDRILSLDEEKELMKKEMDKIKNLRKK